MKLETAVILAKAWCLTTIPLVSTFAGGLAALNMQRVFGVPVALLYLICSSYCAGTAALLAFLSQSFGDFLASRARNVDPAPGRAVESPANDSNNPPPATAGQPKETR